MNIQTVDFKDSAAPKALAASMHETGFAVLTGHPIPLEQINAAYEAWGAFFADDKKQDWLYDPKTQDGFYPFLTEHAKGSTTKDLKEFYHVYPWGRVPEDLESLTRKLYQDLLELGLVILGWLDDAMPDDVRAKMSESLSSMMQGSSQSLLRILHYPPVPDDAVPSAIRAAAHEDINFITLLLAGSRPGLEAMDKHGEWHKISCDSGMITINNADMLSLATGGYYRSTPHRVTNPDAQGENVSRYSMPMFLHPRPDSVLESRSDSDFTAEMFLNQRLKEIGLK